jgi:hypothetical protein
MSDETVIGLLTDIRNWTRAASYADVKALLVDALPDEKSRSAYQMMDGNSSRDEIRIKCKMSPNALLALGERCIAMGLMELRPDKKRVRLFDLRDFGLIHDVNE